MENYYKRRAIKILQDNENKHVLPAFLMGLRVEPYDPDQENIETAIIRFINSPRFENTHQCIDVCVTWDEAAYAYACSIDDNDSIDEMTSDISHELNECSDTLVVEKYQHPLRRFPCYGRNEIDISSLKEDV